MLNIYVIIGGNTNITNLQNKLKRTREAIKIKATRLGLGGAKTNSYKYVTACKISRIMKIDIHKVLKWINEGILKAKHMSLSQNQKVWCVDFEDLITFLENNQNLWDSTRLDEYDLGYEYDWLIEKRKKDKERKLNGRNSKNNNIYVR